MLKSKANWLFKREQNVIHEDIIETLLYDRGITTEAEKELFLHPSLDDMVDASALHNIQKVKDRVTRAIETGEKIAIYGDYDADGVTATALMVKTFERMQADCIFYIPNRFTEGYGMNTEAIDQLHAQGITLVITVDTGIANVAEVSYAKKLGMDVIITDHHEVQEEVPEAYAIIHPKLSNNYPFKQLAGVGVAFQVATYLLGEMPKDLLDLVAIGTIADLVPLIGENRILATKGLERLNETTNIGLRALKERVQLNEVVTARDVGFIIAPRLNAVGRLQDASLAVELLLSDQKEVAMDIATEIEALNVERQQIVAKIVEEAESQVQKEDYFIVLYEQHWHEGVLGICASRLVQKFSRPVMLLTFNEAANEWKGSARSIERFNLFDACMEEQDLFTAFGGHAQAAGMSVPFEHIERLKERLNLYAKERLAETDLKETIKIDCSVPIEAATELLVKKVQALQPFGVEHEEPIFHVRGKPTDIRQIGQNQQHIKISLHDERGNFLEAIGFRLGHLYYGISASATIEVVGTLQINEWNGNRKVQLLIQDIAVNEWQLFDYRGRKEMQAMQRCANLYDHYVVVCHDDSEIRRHFEHLNHGTLMTYDDISSRTEQTDILFIYDMPHDLEQLTSLVNVLSPNAIFVNYVNEENAYLYRPPSREEFKHLYAYLYKYNSVQIHDTIRTIMMQMDWSKEKVIFMLQVFFDLQFIERKDDKIVLREQSKKRPLTESKTYQQRLERGKIEKILYYSTYDELKRWFENWRQWQNAEGEVTYGL